MTPSYGGLHGLPGDFDSFDMVMIGFGDRHRRDRARIVRNPQREAVRQ